MAQAGCEGDRPESLEIVTVSRFEDLSSLLRVESPDSASLALRRKLASRCSATNWAPSSPPAD